MHGRKMAWSGLLIGALGCSPPAAGGKGARCERLSDCAPGLACVDHRCSSDLGALGELGGPPPEAPVDPGSSDAGLDAAAGEPTDAGLDLDAGLGEDAG